MIRIVHVAVEGIGWAAIACGLFYVVVMALVAALKREEERIRLRP